MTIKYTPAEISCHNKSYRWAMLAQKYGRLAALAGSQAKRRQFLSKERRYNALCTEAYSIFLSSSLGSAIFLDHLLGGCENEHSTS